MNECSDGRNTRMSCGSYHIIYLALFMDSCMAVVDGFCCITNVHTSKVLVVVVTIETKTLINFCCTQWRGDNVVFGVVLFAKKRCS